MAGRGSPLLAHPGSYQYPSLNASSESVHASNTIQTKHNWHSQTQPSLLNPSSRGPLFEARLRLGYQLLVLAETDIDSHFISQTLLLDDDSSLDSVRTSA